MRHQLMKFNHDISTGYSLLIFSHIYAERSLFTSIPTYANIKTKKEVNQILNTVYYNRRYTHESIYIISRYLSISFRWKIFNAKYLKRNLKRKKIHQCDNCIEQQKREEREREERGNAEIFLPRTLTNIFSRAVKRTNHRRQNK